jgi:hypothetical protein
MRLNMSMLAAHASGSGGALSAQTGIALLIGLIGLVFSAASLVLTYLSGAFRNRLVYGMTASVQIVDQSAAHPNLHILWCDEEVADPHIVEIGLAYKGHADIKSDFFDKNRPLSFDINAPIIDVLEVVTYPEGARVPKMEAAGVTLKIGPDLLRRRQSWKFVLLVDGPGAQLKCSDNPIANIKEKEVRHPAEELSKVLYKQRTAVIKTVITWSVIIFIAFYLVTQPTSSGHLIASGVNGLHDAGASLARFVDSLQL